jgi:polyisoprenyl-phosphate glycosyltransferase
MQTVDLIIPVYNEEIILLEFHKRLCQEIASLPYQLKIIYIDDGSSDHTQTILSQIADQDQRVTAVELSRNFGHQAAISAGLDLADGDFVITMDGDGQHPPALINEMLRLAQNGYDIILTQRTDPPSLTSFKRRTSALFYYLINRIGNTHILPGGADFRLLTRSALEALRRMPEYHRFIRGMVAWVGFRSVILPFDSPMRIGGQSKYSFGKMLRLAADATFSFSLMPLYAGVSLGAVFLFLALLEAFYVLGFWVTGNTARLAPGWSSLMFMLLIVGGIIMISLGIIGIYVGYIFQEVKHRPVYLIRRKYTKS